MILGRKLGAVSRPPPEGRRRVLAAAGCWGAPRPLGAETGHHKHPGCDRHPPLQHGCHLLATGSGGGEKNLGVPKAGSWGATEHPASPLRSNANARRRQVCRKGSKAPVELKSPSFRAKCH